MNPAKPSPQIPLRARLHKTISLLHGVVGCAAMIAVLFFATTGLMLNNAEAWNLAETREETRAVKLPAEAAGRWKDADAAIVAVLRAGVGVSGIPDTPSIEDGRMKLVFNSAGVRRTVSVSQEDGAAEITTETHGVSGRLMALHRGDYVSKGWRRVMDIAAVSLIVITLSGFTLWAISARRRKLGILALAASALAVTVACFLFT